MCGSLPARTQYTLSVYGCVGLLRSGRTLDSKPDNKADGGWLIVINGCKLAASYANRTIVQVCSLSVL